jgi:hypothetical protein
VAKARPERIDPSWPQAPEGEHAVSELASEVQGAQSPFGQVVFPLPTEELGYRHPTTEINR